MIKVYYLRVIKDEATNTETVEGIEYILHAICETTNDPNVRRVIIEENPILADLALKVENPTNRDLENYNSLLESLKPPHSTHISVIDAIDPTKARPIRIKRVWGGEDYYYDCLVTESIKEQYLTGKIKVGDYVVVFWSDVNEQIVTSKVFKSW